jgi:hypothetical protein
MALGLTQPLTEMSTRDIIKNMGTRAGAVVEALRYKPEYRGIDSRWCHWNFSLT